MSEQTKSEARAEMLMKRAVCAESALKRIRDTDWRIADSVAEAALEKCKQWLDAYLKQYPD